MSLSRWRLVLALALLAGTLPLWADNDAHRAEQHEFLARQLAEFHRLPPAEQERIRRLDRQLRQADPTTQEQWQAAMTEYVRWLAALPEAERVRIEQTPAPQRLVLIQQVREEQALARLPKAVRERILAAPPHERSHLLGQATRELNRAVEPPPLPPPLRSWDEIPWKRLLPDKQFTDAQRDEVRLFVREVLWPMLAPTEQERFWKAARTLPLDEGEELLQLVATLADRHPVRLPGKAGPSRIEELPGEVKLQLGPFRPKAGPLHRKLQQLPNTWPEFALEFQKVAQESKVTIRRPLGPAFVVDLFPAQQAFVRNLLERHPDARKDLNAQLGNWPEFPRTVMELARRHKLIVPLTTLPGPKEFWERYRDGE